MHAVMAKCGVLPELDDMFGPGGQVLLDKMELPQPYRYRVDSLRRLIEVFEDEIDVAESQTRKRLKGHRGYRAVQALHGVGPVMAAIFVAEIGDVSRFASARHLCSWAGLTPSHRESTTRPTGATSPSRAQPGALGGDRSSRALPRRCPHRPNVQACTGAPGDDDRPGGGGREIAHAGLLRAPGRRGPVPEKRGRLSKGSGAARARARRTTWPPIRRGRRLNVPAWLWPELTMHLAIRDGGMSAAEPHGLLAEFSGNGEVTAVPAPTLWRLKEKRRPRPDGGSVAMVAGTIKRRGRQGCPAGGPSVPALTASPSSTGKRAVPFERGPDPNASYQKARKKERVFRQSPLDIHGSFRTSFCPATFWPRSPTPSTTSSSSPRAASSANHPWPTSRTARTSNKPSSTWSNHQPQEIFS